jgi:hypothetical protein
MFKGYGQKREALLVYQVYTEKAELCSQVQ